MRIKNFYEFLLEKKIEVSNELKNKLESLKKSNLVCAKFSANLLNFLNSENIKDDAKADKVDLSMQSKLLDVIYNNAKRPYKLGNFLTYIGFDKYYAYTALEVQDFVSNITKTEGVDNFKEVYGDDILWAYLEDNYENTQSRYVQVQLENRGSLNTSCMRYTECQKYFDIYTKNPKQVCLLVLYNPDGLVRGRCLIWNANDKHYADRIYCSNDRYKANFYQYFEKNNIINNGNIPDIELEHTEYSNYPYMDTLKYYNKENNILSINNYSDDDYKLDNMSGNYNLSSDLVADCGSHAGDVIAAEDAVFLDDDRTAHIDDCVCTYNNDWLLEADCVKLYYPEDKWAAYDDNELIQLSVDIYGDEVYTLEYYICKIKRLDEYILLNDAIKLYDGEYEYKDNKDLLITLCTEYYGKSKYAYRDDENILEIKNEDETKSIFILKADKANSAVQKEVQKWLNEN